MANADELKWERLEASISNSIDRVRIDFVGELSFDWNTTGTVYLIRFSAPYLIKYKKGQSPVAYIGSGTAWRVIAHREGWLKKVPLLLADFAGYEIFISRVRRQNRSLFYKEIESDLVSLFFQRYGERPLFNSVLGRSALTHTFEKFNLSMFEPSLNAIYSNHIQSPATRGEG